MDFTRKDSKSTLLSSKGSIQLILGPLYSGKTTELTRRLQRYTIAKCKCVFVNHTKNDNDALIHEYTKISAESIKSIFENVENCDVVGIDGGHFFPDIDEACEILANKGKIVIVAMVDGDFSRKPIKKILNLIPIAEHVIKLTAVCSNCYRDAAFSKIIRKKDEVSEFIAVCRQCYFLELKNV